MNNEQNLDLELGTWKIVSQLCQQSVVYVVHDIYDMYPDILISDI